jgi:hypothetical protein
LRFVKVATSAFGHIPEFRAHVIPALLSPVWLTRRRYSYDAPFACRGPVLDASQDRLEISGTVPARAEPGGVAWADLRLVVEARSGVPATGPRSVTLTQRWRVRDSLVAADRFKINQLASYPTSLSRDLSRQDQLDIHVPLYAPMEPGQYRVEIIPFQVGNDLAAAGIANAISVPVCVA